VFVALGIQHEKTHVPFCHLWPVRLCNIFSTLPHKCTIFEKKVRNTKCVFWCFSQICLKILITLRKFKLDITINVHRSSSKVPIILVRLHWNLNFLVIFSKNTQVSVFVKIRPVGAELLLHVQRQRDRHDEAESHVSQFYEHALKMKLKVNVKYSVRTAQ